jgi:hypothetical protein
MKVSLRKLEKGRQTPLVGYSRAYDFAVAFCGVSRHAVYFFNFVFEF